MSATYFNPQASAATTGYDPALLQQFLNKPQSQQMSELGASACDSAAIYFQSALDSYASGDTENGKLYEAQGNEICDTSAKSLYQSILQRDHGNILKTKQDINSLVKSFNPTTDDASHDPQQFARNKISNILLGIVNNLGASAGQNTGGGVLVNPAAAGAEISTRTFVNPAAAMG